MKLRAFSRLGTSQNIPLAAKRRSPTTGRASCIQFECLEPRQMLSGTYPYPLLPAG